MKYLKVFTDFEKSMTDLKDAERGRLFTAMLKYAGTGELPDLSGNEKYVWATAKLNIDRTIEEASKRSEAGAVGGSTSKYKQTKAKQSKAKQGKADKEKDKDKDNTSPAEITPVPPLDVAIREFAEHRKQLKKPLTDRARHLLLAELEKLAPGDDEKKIAIINQSIFRGWQGVFQLKTDTSEPESRYNNLRRLYAEENGT